MSATLKTQGLNPFNLGRAGECLHEEGSEELASVSNSLAAFANGEILSARHHALEHAAKGRAGCGLLSGDEWIYMTRFSFSFVTPDESLQRVPGILNKIRGLSYKNSVIKPDFESGVWYVDGGQNDSKANAHSRFDLSVRGPYSEWVRNILKDF